MTNYHCKWWLSHVTGHTMHHGMGHFWHVTHHVTARQCHLDLASSQKYGAHFCVFVCALPFCDGHEKFCHIHLVEYVILIIYYDKYILFNINIYYIMLYLI